MSYKISLAIFHTNPDTYFRVVEQTVWSSADGGSWGEENGRLVLTMKNDSGASGTIRFLAENGENFIVAVGVDNGTRWSDIVTNLPGDHTGAIINAQYYSVPEREEQREKQLSSYSIASVQGRQFSINFTQAEGENLEANIIIG